MNSKTLMIVMEVVSQQLDQYKNNSAICKLILKFYWDRFEYVVLCDF